MYHDIVRDQYQGLLNLLVRIQGNNQFLRHHQITLLIVIMCHNSRISKSFLFNYTFHLCFVHRYWFKVLSKILIPISRWSLWENMFRSWVVRRTLRTRNGINCGTRSSRTLKFSIRGWVSLIIEAKCGSRRWGGKYKDSKDKGNLKNKEICYLVIRHLTSFWLKNHNVSNFWNWLTRNNFMFILRCRCNGRSRRNDDDIPRTNV